MTPAIEATDVETAIDACRELNLTGLAPGLEDLCHTAIKRKLTYPTFLTEALRVELDIRHERRRARRVHEARLPRIKTLDEFDVEPTVVAADVAATLQSLLQRGLLEPSA